MKIRKEEREYKITPDAIYQADVASVEEAGGSHKDKNGKERTWAALRFKFNILADMLGNVCDSVGNIVQGQMYAGGKAEDGSLIINPGTELDKWLGVLGVNIQVGEELDTDKLKGSKCMVVIEVKDKYSNVTDIKPMAATQAPKIDASKPSAPAAPAPSAVNNKDVFSGTQPVQPTTQQPAKKGTIPF